MFSFTQHIFFSTIPILHTEGMGYTGTIFSTKVFFHTHPFPMTGFRLGIVPDSFAIHANWQNMFV